MGNEYKELQLYRKFLKQEAELKTYSGSFMDLGLPEFMDIFRNNVVTSQTRKVDYYLEGDNYYFFISLPDQVYRLVVGISKISEVVLNELTAFGRRVKA